MRLGLFGLIDTCAAVWLGGLLTYADHDRLELLDRPWVSDCETAITLATAP